VLLMTTSAEELLPEAAMLADGMHGAIKKTDTQEESSDVQ
jgi:hypothetical protein